MISHLRNIFLLLITCFLALIIFLPTPALARGQCSTAASTMATSTVSGGGTQIQSWLKRVFHDPNNNRWHVIYIDSSNNVRTASTADNDCTTWTDGTTVNGSSYSYDEFSCALDVQGAATYLHCATFDTGTNVLYVSRCTLTGTTPFITSCSGVTTTITLADPLDDFQSVDIEVDSNHCVLIVADIEDNSLDPASIEHQVSFFKETGTCGDGTWTGTGPTKVQTVDGYNLDTPVGIRSFGDLDAQIFWVVTDTAGTFFLRSQFYNGTTDAFGTERILDTDIEGSGTAIQNDSVAWSTNTVTLGYDDTLDSLQAYYTTTKDGTVTQVDTNVNGESTASIDRLTIVRDTKSTGTNDVWAFATDTTDGSDIDYSVSTDGGVTWAAATNNWLNDELNTEGVSLLSSAFNTENCDIMVTWRTNTSPYDISTKVINTGSCSITVSGTMYTDEGSTVITGGGLMTYTVAGVVNGDSSTLKYYPHTGTGTTYSMSLVVDESTIEPIHIWMNGYADWIGGTFLGNTVTRHNGRGNNLTGIDLYLNHVIARHEDAGPLTATDMLTWENADDSEMLIYTGFGGLGTESGSELFVKSTETLSASGSAFFAVDDLDVNGTLNMTGLLLQAQGGTTSTWDFTGGTLTSGGPLTVNGNSLTLTSNAATFTNLTIGANASLTTNDNLDLNGNISITNGTGETIDITGDTLNVAGNMDLSNLDTFTVTTSTVIFDGTTTLTSNSKAFNHVQIGSASAAGSLTTADTMDINGTLSVNNGGATTWNISDDTITAASTFNLTNLDTFTVAGSTVRFDGAALQTVTSASKTYNTLTSTNASANGVSFADPWTAADFINETAGSKLTFNAGSTYTITGALSLLGTTGAGKISILSGTASSPFYFDVPSCKGVKYVTVIDSEVTGTAGEDMKAIDSESTDTRTDSAGASPKWYFNSGSCAKKGAIIIVD